MDYFIVTDQKCLYLSLIHPYLDFYTCKSFLAFVIVQSIHRSFLAAGAAGAIVDGGTIDASITP